MASPQKSIFITRKLPQDALKVLASSSLTVEMHDHEATINREDLLKKIKGHHGIMCVFADKIDEELLQSAGKQLETISTISVGYEHIDLDACKSRSITIGYTPDVLTDAVAELTLGLLLSVSRRIVEGTIIEKKANWTPAVMLGVLGKGLANSVVGIVGLGRIGQAIARRIVPFKPSRILYSGNSEKSEANEIGADFVSFDSLLNQSDFVICSCSVTKQTVGLFNKEAFSKMKKSAIFINISRGQVVNQKDLYDALKSGSIHSAGLDVTTPEPLPANHMLQTLPNCVIIPHFGSAECNTRHQMVELACENIVAALNGKPIPKEVEF